MIPNAEVDVRLGDGSIVTVPARVRPHRASFWFEAHGLPAAQGSKRAFVVTPKVGKPKAVVTESAGDKLKNWRSTLNGAAQTARGDRPALEGAVNVEMHFRLRAPQKLKHEHPIGRVGDVDKLARAVLDACSGVLFLDDSQVVDLRVTKAYGDPGVTVYVEPV